MSSGMLMTRCLSQTHGPGIGDPSLNRRLTVMLDRNVGFVG